jgi:hypothetical protein
VEKVAEGVRSSPQALKRKHIFNDLTATEQLAEKFLRDSTS